MSTNRRRTLLSAKLGLFAKQYGRKAQKRVEPNDRRHSNEVENLAKHLPAGELSELLVGESDEPLPPVKRKHQKKQDRFASFIKRKT
jgi:hypothetical protein